jgi:methionyl-tRNA formyltransferase
VVAAYGQILSRDILAVAPLGGINVHASLLPKYRGAAPINWAIINGETRTGLTTMQINAGLDTGPLLLKYETDVGADETAAQLTARLAQAGAPLIVETLRKLASGEIEPAPQDDSQATHAQAIYNRIRGLQPWPGGFTTFRGKTCRIWGKPGSPVAPAGLPGTLLPSQEEGLRVIAGGATVLRVEHLQPEARHRVTDSQFMSGARITPGERFGS